MKKNLLIASVLLTVCQGAFAEWVKPAAPKSMAFAASTECYLYNKEADGFLLGANNYGTRASVSQTLGHKVYFEAGTDAKSYYISNYVLYGWMQDQIGYMFVDNADAIYVDNTKDGKKNNQYTLEFSGNEFKIGLSDQNETWTEKDNEGVRLGTKSSDIATDSRIYVIDPGTEGACLTWYCVSPTDYAAYVTAAKAYNASVVLGDQIKEAKTAGAPADAISAAETVYNNSASTEEQLIAAANTLKDAVKNVKYNAATVDNPLDMMSLFGYASDFTDGKDTGWSSTTGAQNKQASNGNNAADFSVTGNHYENWNGSAFTPGKISVTFNDVAAGVYRINALAFTNTGKDAYLFIGNGRTAVTSTKIDKNNEYSVYTIIEAGNLEAGLDIPVQGPNWVGLDNVKVEYLGNNDKSVQNFVSSVLSTEPDYEELIANKSIACEVALLTKYSEAKQAFEKATAANALSLYNAFQTASDNLVKSVNAHASYVETFNKASKWVNETSGQSDEIDLLAEYTGMNSEPDAAEYNGNGSGAYIMENGIADATKLAAETKYLNDLYYQAMANSMKDGDDCTSMLKNPNFTESGGWTYAQGITIPAGSDQFKVFEAWGRVCDVKQSLEGLQNGIYEMDLQAVYKHDGDADIRQTYAYINDFDTQIGLVIDGETVNDATGASEAFAAGKYPVKAFGLVTDGKMTLGIANRLRTGENGILWAGGVTLTYRARNAEACASLLAALTPQANALKEAITGADNVSALNEALTAAAGVSGDEGYAALVDLKKAIDAANKGVELYSALDVALKNLDDAIKNANADAMTVQNAKDLLSEASVAYDAKSYSNAEAEKAVSDVKAMTTSLKMGGQQATEDNPVEYTSAIVNNNFDPAKGSKDEKRIDGWEVEGALNGYKSYSCSFNKGTFKLTQTIEGLPKGNYKVTVQTYYRAGSYEEEGENINAGKDTHLMKLFANDAEMGVMNLSEGSKDVTLPEGIGTKTINGITVPDGTGSSVKCYEAGLFLNELRFTVGEDGKAVIGLKLDQTIGTNDYTVVGPWKLWYMGDAAAVQDYTSLITNNNFDPAKGSKDEKRIDGWVVSGALNGYKSYSCSFNKGTFDLHQDIEGLPKGKYKVTVNTYYRAGSYEEEGENINAGKDTHLMKLYANDAEKGVMNLSEGSTGVTLPEGIGTKTINGITVPDGTGSSVKCYEAGLFLNELEFTVGDDGKARIGLKLDQTIGTNDYTVVGPWHLYYYGDVADVTETSYSNLIVNNDFDPAKGSKDEKRIDGWVVTGALNGYKSNTCSFNKGTFDLHQDLEGLPEGTYKVTVHTYYRAGSYEEEAANINAGKDTHLMKLYAKAAKDYETSVMNLSEGSKDVTLPEGVGTKDINGIAVPDGTGNSVKCFNAGLFLNELVFYVDNTGKATIGLKLDQTIGTNDYTVVGKWDLYYYGSGNNIDTVTGVEEVEAAPAEATPVAFYSITGARLDAPQKGVNIVKMSDGTARKVYVK